LPERRFPSPRTVEETDADPLPARQLRSPNFCLFDLVKLLPSGVFGGCVMSDKVLELPARVRCDRAARELRESVIGVLKEVRRHGGDAAFHRAARLGGEARRHSARVRRRRSDDRPAGLRSLGGNLNSWHTTWSDLDRA
jgi:hypothetical protein